MAAKLFYALASASAVLAVQPQPELEGRSIIPGFSPNLAGSILDAQSGGNDEDGIRACRAVDSIGTYCLNNGFLEEDTPTEQFYSCICCDTTTALYTYYEDCSSYISASFTGSDATSTYEFFGTVASECSSLDMCGAYASATTMPASSRGNSAIIFTSIRSTTAPSSTATSDDESSESSEPSSTDNGEGSFGSPTASESGPTITSSRGGIVGLPGPNGSFSSNAPSNSGLPGLPGSSPSSRSSSAFAVPGAAAPGVFAWVGNLLMTVLGFFVLL